VASAEALRALVRRHIEQGFNRGDWSVCETTLADDYTARYGANGEANVGRDHYVRVCTYLRRSFPDVNITIEDLVVEGDKIVMRYTERGTLTGRPFLGIEPAGQQYAKPGTTMYRVVGSRLAESWGVEDTLGWFRQLGVTIPIG
jgi:predicted ester cyclase